jgi:hypothetical protein
MWAPVLQWQVAAAGPALVVFMGKRAERFGRAAISGVEHLPRFKVIEHYSYVAMRPDHLGRGPGHPDRVKGYQASIAVLRDG